MRSSIRWTIALVAVGALAIGTLVGCTPTQSTTGNSTTPVKGGTFSFYIGNPAYIDPYNVQETEGAQVDHQLFTALTAFDPLNPTNLIPAAASSWSSNSDATVWTFKLNPADKFSDGNPVTAQDFIYAWNRIANPKTINTSTGKVDPSVVSYYLQPVEGYNAVQAGKATTMSGLKAVDNYTLQVTLSAPFGDFAYVVGNPALAPVEQSLVQNGVMYNGNKVNFGDMPVGNGPFKMAEPWVQGQYIKLVRNDDYFGKQPYIDGINFEIFSDPNTAYMAF
jgi:ABC-type oligopeptide transport system substrate-binding subunit